MWDEEEEEQNRKGISMKMMQKGTAIDVSSRKINKLPTDPVVFGMNSTGKVQPSQWESPAKEQINQLISSFPIHSQRH